MEFDEAYAAAREGLELTGCSRASNIGDGSRCSGDPARFASIARRAAEPLTGHAVPAAEPLAETRRRAGT